MKEKERTSMPVVGILIAFLLGRYFVQIDSIGSLVEWLYTHLPMLQIITFFSVLFLLVFGYYRLKRGKKAADSDDCVSAVRLFLYASIFAVIGLISCFV